MMNKMVARVFLHPRITELWWIGVRNIENVDEDHFSFFKAGLWQAGFLNAAKNGTVFSRN